MQAAEKGTMKESKTKASWKIETSVQSERMPSKSNGTRLQIADEQKGL